MGRKFSTTVEEQTRQVSFSGLACFWRKGAKV